jgi:predicted transcriptional regulator
MAIKLNEEKVRQIMTEYWYNKNGRVASELMADLAKKYEVNITTISRVVNRKISGHVWKR